MGIIGPVADVAGPWMKSAGLAGAGRVVMASGGRTEAVLLAALRAAAPAVRAVRSADRANMVM